MRHFLAVVEGPHDASFVGVVLRRRGFRRVEAVEAIDPFWAKLIPSVFPDGPRLGHVVHYPDLYQRDEEPDMSFAVQVAGGDSRLVSELRAAMEIVPGSAAIDGICVVADADEHPADRRHEQLSTALRALNASHGPGGEVGGVEGWPGFPLAIPAAAGEIAAGTPRVGLYVLPDNDRPGTLDVLLLECARSSMPALCPSAETFVDDVADIVAEDVRFKALRKPSGKTKAGAGVIANVLLPGSALSNAVDRAEWFEPLDGGEKAFNAFVAFMDKFLA